MVRAKFKVSSITQHDDNLVDINMSAVTGGSEENKQFWKYTPSGQLTLQCLNPSASEYFKPGEEYYLDFTLAENDDSSREKR